MPTAAPRSAARAPPSTCTRATSRRRARRWRGRRAPAVARGDERAQGADGFRRRPVARPDHVLDDAAVAVDDERLGVPPDTVAVADLVFRIEEHGERQLHPLDERLDDAAPVL